jgi:hypothetical protein
MVSYRKWNTFLLQVILNVLNLLYKKINLILIFNFFVKRLETDTNCKGSINLLYAQVQTYNDDNKMTNNTNDGETFKVTSSLFESLGKTIYLKAANNDEKRKWMEAIEKEKRNAELLLVNSWACFITNNINLYYLYFFFETLSNFLEYSIIV